MWVQSLPYVGRGRGVAVPREVMGRGCVGGQGNAAARSFMQDNCYGNMYVLEAVKKDMEPVEGSMVQLGQQERMD